MLKSTCTLVGATALVSIGGSAYAFAETAQASGVPKVGDTFVYKDGPNKDKVVTVADIVVGAAPVTVQAWDSEAKAVRDSDHATVLLWRVAPGSVPEDLKGSDAEGVLAFSAMCTHLGCMLTDWKADLKVFVCPCHEAFFAPMEGGKNTGGATSRTLPYLPIKAVDGKVVVADKFIGYVGPKRG